MKIKELFKKVGKTVTAGLFGLSSAGVANAVTAAQASAASYNCSIYSAAALNSADPGNKWNIGTNVGGYGYDTFARFTVDGKKAYCVQQNVLALIGSASFNQKSLAEWLQGAGIGNKAETLERIAAFGYGYGGDTSPEMDFATQIRIWQEMKLGSITNIHPDIQAKINQINNRLDSYNKNINMKKASEGDYDQNKFDGNTIALKKAGENHAAIIYDENGVLEANYSVVSASNGLHVEKLSGNKLKVWVDEGTEFSENKPLNFTLNGYFNGNGGSVAYFANGYQTVALLKSPKGKQFSFSVVPDVHNATPKISTTATSDGIKEINIYDDSTSFVDTVSYQDVITDYSYTIKGQLIDKKTGKAIDGATSEKTFTATNESGSVDLNFSVDTKKLLDKNDKTKDVVCYETLYQNTPNIGSSKSAGEVVSHKDINDKNQTVTVNQPKLGTQAKIDGEKVVNSFDKQVTLTDDINYTNLKVGKEYTAVGTLMNKASGTAVQGQTAVKKFTPTKSNGSVTVEFKVNPAELATGNFVVFESIKNNKETEIVNHKDLSDADQTVLIKKANIGTRASIEGDKVINTKDKTVELVDTVDYSGLVPGKQYSLKAKLVDKNTKKVLNYTASAKFTANTENGSQNVVFKVNPKDVDGKNLVVFETLYDQKDREVAKHEDINDVGQTVEIRTPKIGTTAKLDGTKVVNAKNKKVELVDTVSYSGLIKGNTYTLESMIMDQETGKEITEGVEAQIIDSTSNNKNLKEDVSSKDKNSKSSTKFIADSETGTVDVKFTIDLSKNQGKKLVVFEKLFDKHNDLITKHEDINDEGQTVEDRIPYIGTSALVDNKKAINTKDKTVELIDTVSYSGLIAGNTYTLNGMLMDKATKQQLTEGVTAQIIDPSKENKDDKDTSKSGKETEKKDDASDSSENTKDEGQKTNKTDKTKISSTKFVADGESGTVLVKFTLDLSKIKGKDLVVYEDLFDKDNDELVSHHDNEDKDQTVEVPEAKIGTKATINGQKTVVAGGVYELNDEVSYENLIPGKKYTLKGVLMDKSTGKVFDSNAVTVQKVNDVKEQKEEHKDYLEDTSKDNSDVTGATAKSFVDKKDEAGASYSLNYKYDNKKYAITVYLDKEAMDLNNAGKEFVADVSIAGPNVSQNGVYQVKFTKEMLSKLTEIGKSSENKDEKPADRLKALNEYIANLFENVVEPTNKEDKEDKKDTTDNKDEAKKDDATQKSDEQSKTASETVFIPEQSSGTINVKFKVDTDKLGGTSLVVFEKLYDEDNDKVASHEDINDADQTVEITKKPTPNTGIETGIASLAAIGVISLLASKKLSNKKSEN